VPALASLPTSGTVDTTPEMAPVDFVRFTRTSVSCCADTRLTVDVCVATELDLRLPLDDGFRDADLEPQDLGEQLTATEGPTT